MFTKFFEQLKPSCLMFLWLSVLTGLCYPLVVTAVGTGLFPYQVDGSLLRRDGTILGSVLIGQPFTTDRYFRTRPSATAPFSYNAANSSGSNLAPSNPALREAAQGRVNDLATEGGAVPLPMDLITASASGLDPHISPEAAAMQVDRVAKARGLTRQRVADIVAQHTQDRLWGFWGEPRVTVLSLNLALDALGNAR